MSATIPANPDEVTSAWLSQALSIAGAQTLVRTVTFDPLVRGAATKLRLRIDYAANPRSLPQVLWVKAGWEDHSSFMQEMGVYVREALYYAEFAPLLDVRAPRCYWVRRDAQGRAAVIIEDLETRGAALWSCTAPRSVDDVRSLLDGLAHIHGKFWQDPRLALMEGIDVLIDATGPTAVWPRQTGGENLRRVMDGPRGRLMPAYTRAPERIEKSFWRMVETLDRRNGRCLLHGDPHPGNCFSDADGGAGLYDWQTLTRGPWAFDVSYAITTALSTTDRRHHERDLLAHYLRTLSQIGIATVPSFDEAWDDYCRYLAYALLIWPTNRNSHQAEENILALTERLGAAAADFKLFERWGS